MNKMEARRAAANWKTLNAALVGAGAADCERIREAVLDRVGMTDAARARMLVRVRQRQQRLAREAAVERMR